MGKPIDKDYLKNTLVSFNQRVLNNEYARKDEIVEGHTHENKDILDKLSENSDGILLFNGNQINGSSNIDIDDEMSDISTNPVQNKTIKKYIDDKEINVSAEADNAIEEKDDGLYVENKTEEINFINEKLNKIKKYQKYVNTELDSCFCKVLSPYTPVEGEVVPFISVSGNMENTEGKIKLNPGERVQVIGNINYYNQSTNSNANIIYALKDITNNIEICIYQPYSSPSDTNNEFSYSFAAQYENSTNSDCEIGLVVKNVYVSDTVFTTSNMTIQEINRAITINPIEYVNSTQGIEDSPIGHIISHMGNTAPTHYLICDGAEYNITDYPYLAQHFIDEFGSVNYFGGDGIDTFAVPDLRGEFLRGTGIATRNSGSGANVGVHQEATTIPNIGGKETSILWIPTADNYSAWVQNIDKGIKDDAYSGLGKYANRDGTWNSGDPSNTNIAYTVRPTNTSVLYCIKYEPTYYMYNNKIYEGLDKTILFEGEANSVILDKSILNYDYLKIYIWLGANSLGLIEIPMDNFLNKEFSAVNCRSDLLSYIFEATCSISSDYVCTLNSIGYLNGTTYSDRLSANGYCITSIIGIKGKEA